LGKGKGNKEIRGDLVCQRKTDSIHAGKEREKIEQIKGEQEKTRQAQPPRKIIYRYRYIFIFVFF